MAKRSFSITQQSIVVIPAVTVTFTSVTVEKYNDDGDQIDCLLSFGDGSGRTLQVQLWDSASYPGARTPLQIKNRIITVLNLTP